MSILNKKLYAERIRKLINEFYNNPILKKIEDDGGFSVYATKVHCLLKEKRYIIFYSLLDSNKVGSFVKLKDIKWVSLQTKTISDENNIVVSMVGNICYQYEPRKIKELNKVIKLSLKDSTDNSNVYYTTDKFIKIYLKLVDSSIYSNNGTILKALETFNTILTFNFDIKYILISS